MNEAAFSDLCFDPAKGQVIREPDSGGYGYWVGGMKAFYDAPTEKFYLFYRQRAPLERGRGGSCFVAESDDGVTFSDVWQADKRELCATSIEVGQLCRHGTDPWRLYLSYEYENGNYWRIDVLEGASPAELVTGARRTVLSPHDFGLGFIKDPFVVHREGRYWLYACGSPRRRAAASGSGELACVGREATLLFTSVDGLYFDRGRYVFEPTGVAWDAVTARLGCVFEYGAGWAAFYDGARTIYDMYEESTGLCASNDGLGFRRVSLQRPWLRPPRGNARYVFALPTPDALFVYYEYTREDGSHDMRVVKLPSVGGRALPSGV